MDRLGMEEDVPIEHGMVNPQGVENAQKKVEARNFEPQARARVRRRDEPAAQGDLQVKAEAEAKAKELAEKHERAKELGLVPQALSLYDRLEALGTREDMVRLLYVEAEKIVHAYESKIGLEQLTRVYRALTLDEIDRAWIDHLTNMDHLRDGIGCAATASATRSSSSRRRASTCSRP
jgi:preprotein translocase subunit SecA